MFTFVQLYENCDFHTAFLRLGGTDRRKGERLTDGEKIAAYRARRAVENRKKLEQKKKDDLDEIGREIDACRNKMNASEPLSDEWTEAYNRWMNACRKQAELTGDDLTQL